MSAPVAWRIARRELRGGLRGFRVFLACLALGGDAMVELTYRRASPEEWAVLQANAERIAEVIDFRSMAVRLDEGDRALTQVKAVDENWPLLGAPVLEPEMRLAQALNGSAELPGAVLDPLLAARLELQIGDIFLLGDQKFVFTAELLQEPDAANAGFGLGPRSIVRNADLAASGLIQEGTLFDAEYRLDLPEGTDLAQAKETITGALEESAPRWRDARNGAPGIRRAVERLGAFLVLVGLAGLAVGGVGISAAVRAYLDEKTETVATLKSLGADNRIILMVYGFQIGILALFGIALGLALGALLPLVLGPVITAALPVPVELGVTLRPLLEAGAYGLLVAAIFTYWPLAQTEEIRAAALFRDAVMGERAWPRLRVWILSGILLALLIGVATVFSGMAALTLWSAAGLFGAFVLLLLAARGVRVLARWLAGGRWLRGWPTLRMALGAVGGPNRDAVSVVLSLGLGLSVLAAVGQIDNNLRGAIVRELPDVAPSFFVLDIQPDQIDAVRARVEGDAGVSRMDAAPMLRGVIVRINGQDAREFARGHWVVRGDRGVTYAENLPERTALTAGEWWPENYSGPPLISFSAREAEEIGLQIGDMMVVNILGREIEARVASFRDVDFSTAGMGFTIAMNPSALAGAPHSWIATIYAEEAAEPALMRDLSRAHRNITVVAVGDVIGQVTQVMGQVAAAITYGALITLVSGAVVLIGAAAAGERARSYEAAILKTLGASRGRVLLNFALRSVILGAAAGVVAVFAGGLAGWAVSRFLMETAFQFDLGSALAIVLGGVVVTLLAGVAFAWGPLAARPARVLRARE